MKEKYFNIIKKYLSNNKLFLTYLLFSVIIGFILRLVTVGGHIYIRAILTDLLFVLFIGCFGYLFSVKNRYKYYFVWLFFFTALAVANTIYFQFYQSFISVNLLKTASMIGKVNDSLWAKMHIIQFGYLVFPILFLFLEHKLNKDNYYQKLDNIETNWTKFKRAFIIVFFLIVLSLCTFSFNDARKFVNQWNKEFIVKKYGLYLYTINDLVQNIDIKTSYEYDNAALVYRNYYSCKWKKEKTTNEYTNIFEGKNVLFIHAESIQNFLIDLKINGKEVTPNINKFAKEGMYFSKFYPQISVGTSSDTEFTLLTGLMPSSKGTVFVNYFNNKYYALPEYLKNKGYYTFSMHANDADYWNRKTMHEALGYDKFYAKEYYDINEKNTIGLGLSDKSFFKQSIPLLKNIKENNSPFFGTIITLSNHSPFSDIENYGEFDISMKYNYKKNGMNYTEVSDYLDDSTIGNYLRSSHYADAAFGLLISKLEENNLLDNTIIVFYGDHEARIPKNDFNLLYNYDPINDEIKSEDDPSYISMDNYYYELLKNTPLIIWSNDKSLNLSSQVNETMGMYDVLPTIANMFNFEEKYSLGHDIFSEEENIVVFPNGNVLTDKVYYSSANEEYVTLTEEPISSGYIERISEYANNILEVSNGIIYNDLILNINDSVGECNEK